VSDTPDDHVVTPDAVTPAPARRPRRLSDFAIDRNPDGTPVISESIAIPREMWAPAAAAAMADVRAERRADGICAHGGIQARCSYCKVELENDTLRAEVAALQGQVAAQRALLDGIGQLIDAANTTMLPEAPR
jgi:hypothetical protein